MLKLAIVKCSVIVMLHVKSVRPHHSVTGYVSAQLRPEVNTIRSSCLNQVPFSPRFFTETTADEVLGGGGNILEQLVGKLELGSGDVAERLGVCVTAERREARQKHIG